MVRGSSVRRLFHSRRCCVLQDTAQTLYAGFDRTFSHGAETENESGGRFVSSCELSDAAYPDSGCRCTTDNLFGIGL